MESSAPQTRPLTPRQALYVEHYLACRNKTQAAREAGYTEKNAAHQGSRIFQLPQVQAAILAGEKQIRERIGDGRERRIAELKKLAYRRTFRGEPVPLALKLKALVELCKLAGDYPAQKHEVSGHLTWGELVQKSMQPERGGTA